MPTTTLKKYEKGMEKTGKKGSVAFETETSPNLTLLKIPVHDMDIFIMAKKKKNPRLIHPYCDQCGVKGIGLNLCRSCFLLWASFPLYYLSAYLATLIYTFCSPTRSRTLSITPKLQSSTWKARVLYGHIEVYNKAEQPRHVFPC